jgi:hypothetical protein
MTLKTLKRAWDYFMNRSLKPIPKAESRLKPFEPKAMTRPLSKEVNDSIRFIYSKDMPDKCSTCDKCGAPYSRHKWDDKKELTIHPREIN